MRRMEMVTINPITTMWLLVHRVAGTPSSSIFIHHSHWLSNHLYDNQPPPEMWHHASKTAPNAVLAIAVKFLPHPLLFYDELKSTFF
jgi:hypothetical protein